jgi:hypothetical protein
VSIGISAAWRAKQPKQKRCDRCELYSPVSLNICVHCSELNESELEQLKEQHQETLEDNAIFGSFLLFCAVIIGLLLLLSFL